jgi:serine/threonine protein kinase
MTHTSLGNKLQSESPLKDESYQNHLQRCGFTPDLKGVWLKVDRSHRVQGWKLHVSGVPAEAPVLLDAILPILRDWKVPFKIARDSTILGLLNEGSLGATQVGKFCTIYPASDEDAAVLSTKLIQATKGLDGPVITSDMWLGNLVYTRYGSFDSIVQRDLLGQHHLYIEGSDGELIPDVYSQPFVPPPFVPCPFERPSASENTNDHEATSGGNEKVPTRRSTFGPGYVLVDVIKRHAKGNVYLAIMARSQESVAGRIIKEGRKHCLSDIHGRDIRVRLKRQGEFHERLNGVVQVPLCDPYFEVDGDGYLPLEFLPGADLETVVQATLKRGTWRAADHDKKLRLLDALRQLVDVVERLHGAGFVHRDLSVSNVWLGDDGRTYLLDLEIAHHIDDPNPVFGKGTPGFMAPEQEAGAVPTFTQDIHATAALVLFAFTGLDPRRTLFARGASRIRNIRHLAESVPDDLLSVVLASLSDDPMARPALADMQKQLVAYEAGMRAKPSPNGSASRQVEGLSLRERPANFDSCASGAGLGLLRHSFRDLTSGLWLSACLSNSAVGQEHMSSYELRRGANRGVSGVIYVISRLCRSGILMEEAAPAVRNAVEWLLSDAVAPDSGMPGLHFGDAGVAVSIAEAVLAGLTPRTLRIDEWLAHVFDAPISWSDVTHGAAGQGMAAIMCAQSLRTTAPLEMAHRCARHLVETQASDGSWITPNGVPGMSGETLTGFAHGVSGIVFFLLEHAASFDDKRSGSSAERGLGWLADQAMSTDDAHAAIQTHTDTQGLCWRYSDRQEVVWSWWCHGAPGIALTFLRAYRRTKDPAMALIARRALASIDPEMRAPNLTTCHGLSGLGEIFLEAAEALEDPGYREKAAMAATTILHLGHCCEDGGLVWLSEDPVAPTADLMVGMGGIAHFLTRLSSRGKGLTFPLLP